MGKSGPPYTRVQSGHDLIRGDLWLRLPCELLIEGQIRGHLIFRSIQALTEVVQLTLPQHQKSWWSKINMGVKLENGQTGRSPIIFHSTVVSLLLTNKVRSYPFLSNDLVDSKVSIDQLDSYMVLP